MRIKHPVTWLVVGLLILLPGGTATELTFARVGYPGAGFGGVPLTFDIARKYENLMALERQGTLDLFAVVQLIDVTIIVGTLLVFTALALLASRAVAAGPGAPRPGLRRVGRLTVAAFLAAPAMDALENVSLLALIAFRDQRPDWLSLANSCFTLGKVSMFILGWCGLAVLAGALAVSARGRRRSRRTSST